MLILLLLLMVIIAPQIEREFLLQDKISVQKSFCFYKRKHLNIKICFIKLRFKNAKRFLKKY